MWVRKNTLLIHTLIVATRVVIVTMVVSVIRIELPVGVTRMRWVSMSYRRIGDRSWVAMEDMWIPV